MKPNVIFPFVIKHYNFIAENLTLLWKEFIPNVMLHIEIFENFTIGVYCNIQNLDVNQFFKSLCWAQSQDHLGGYNWNL